MTETHKRCHDCGSSDALADYGDHTYCFSCGRVNRYAEGSEGTTDDSTAKNTHHSPMVPPELLQYVPLESRKISRETCTKYGVGVHKDEKTGEFQLVFPYYSRDGRTPVAQKFKTKDKRFFTRGDMKEAGLFGAQIWRKNLLSCALIS